MPRTTPQTLPILALVISAVLGISTLLGLPKCYDFQTKAEAANDRASDRASIQLQIDRIESKVDKLLEILINSR